MRSKKIYFLEYVTAFHLLGVMKQTVSLLLAGALCLLASCATTSAGKGEYPTVHRLNTFSYDMTQSHVVGLIGNPISVTPLSGGRESHFYKLTKNWKPSATSLANYYLIFKDGRLVNYTETPPR